MNNNIANRAIVITGATSGLREATRGCFPRRERASCSARVDRSTDALHLFRQMITTGRSALRFYSRLSTIRSLILGIFAVEGWCSKKVALAG
jgi:hypothetical protein